MLRFITRAAIAQHAGVSIGLVRHWEERGHLVIAARTVGGIHLFDAGRVRRWLCLWRQNRRRPYRRTSTEPIAGLDYDTPPVMDEAPAL